MASVSFSRVLVSCFSVASIFGAVSLSAAAQSNSQSDAPASGVLNGLSGQAKDAGQKSSDNIQPAMPGSPIVEAVRARLKDKGVIGKANGDDVAAMQAFYNARADEVWIKDGAFNDKAKAIIAEFKKAEDWGLESSSYDVADIASGAPPEALADAEAKLTLAAMKYARHSRGGRVDPLSLSNILDMKPPIKDPKAVLSELTASNDPAAYLTGLHPKHAQFEKLRQALLKARGPVQAETTPADDALSVKLPAEGKTLKRGAESDDVVLLRRRLKLTISENANQRYFDEKLEAALKSFQENKSLKANGQLTEKTRAALNREGQPKKPESKGDQIGRLIANMERWRWLPEDLGDFYVINNVPEYMSRVVKSGSEVFKTKLVVGQPTWPTPVLAAKMENITFHPEWGMPDGIKVKELLPRLKRAGGGGGGFFDQLFNGGSSGGARVLAAYKLKPSINGRPVDPDKIDWGNVDIRQFSFTQPAGGENPLGVVKFRFPNRHDVYMHDTPQKALFGHSHRALSHGCMRVEEPRRLAEVILAEDKGWSKDKVSAQYGGGTNEVALNKQVPVYMTYFTARVGEDGRVERYSDIYGHDERLMSALQGKAVRYSEPDNDRSDVVADSSYDPPETVSGKKNKKQASRSKREPQTVGDLLMDALTNF